MGKAPEIFSLARLHVDQPFEDIFKGMKQMQDEGLFGAFGASELKRETLEKANKVCLVVI
jgi:aryl-alcohol dehydrogenase-like predicted oxidoreductase